ncbi:VanZ family protein [Listeria innocua]|uniref:VanZ family protein n=1 Tax=Listeria innocua TaxID=1642 RepID=UPI001624009F|nr:VanZ family protein [Listeria innocua]MBC1923437.1 VanZ family protein [Listeria innocua]
MTTIPLSIPMTILFVVVFELVYLGFKKFNISKSALGSYMFVAYLAILTEVVLLPFNLTAAGETYPLEAYVQITPFQTILFYLKNIPNLHLMIQFLGNVVLLVPFAIYINRFKNISVLKNIVLALGISLIIEISQGILNLITQYPNNVTDIDDVILNVSGYVLAWLIFSSFKSNNNRPKPVS